MRFNDAFLETDYTVAVCDFLSNWKTVQVNYLNLIIISYEMAFNIFKYNLLALIDFE